MRISFMRYFMTHLRRWDWLVAPEYRAFASRFRISGGAMRLLELPFPRGSRGYGCFCSVPPFGAPLRRLFGAG